MRFALALSALIVVAGTAAADVIPVSLQLPSSLATANSYPVPGSWQAYASDYSWYSANPMMAQSAVEATTDAAILRVLGQAGQETTPPTYYQVSSAASLQGQLNVAATDSSPAGTPLVLTLQAGVQSVFPPSRLNWTCTVYNGSKALGTMGNGQGVSVPVLAGQAGLRVEIYASNDTFDSFFDDTVTIGWTAAPGFVREDTNHDAAIDSLDLDAIFAHFGAGSNQWDFNSDGTVNEDDVTALLQNHFHTSSADADLDRKVGFTDLQTVINHWMEPSDWAKGDFNGDRKTNFLDFQLLIDYWNPLGIPLTAVPEPATLAVLIVGAAVALRRKRSSRTC